MCVLVVQDIESCREGPKALSAEVSPHACVPNEAALG